MNSHLDRFFPRYSEYDPIVPIWCITAPLGRCIHRFFDTSPISPSRRFLAVTRLPYENRAASPGDAAEVIVIDLTDGSWRTVAKTLAWDMQLGAQVQWGATDQYLYFNDLEAGTWRPFGVRYDMESGNKARLQGTVYMISPDGSLAASPCLLRTTHTQSGYGVVVPEEFLPKNTGAEDNDGVYLTDTFSGERLLLASFKRIIEETNLHLYHSDYSKSAFYGFHTKWNRDGSRLMFVIRNKPLDGSERQNYIITMKSDGSDIRLALHWNVWMRGGHHPNWHPDGERITMNLTDERKRMRFVQFMYDGSQRTFLSQTLKGSGHPSMHQNQKYILTDAYLHEKMGVDKKKTVPLRIIDLKNNAATHFAEIDSRPTSSTIKELRVDPHPAWCRDYSMIAFNGCSGGTRNVYVADLSKIDDVLSPKRKASVLRRLSRIFTPH